MSVIKILHCKNFIIYGKWSRTVIGWSYFMQYLLHFWELKIVINTNTQQGHFGRSCQLKWRVTESGHAKRASNQNILVIRDMKNIETCLATTMNRHIITIHRHIITFYRHIITFHWHIITFHRPVITNHRHVIKNYVVCALYGEGLIIYK